MSWREELAGLREHTATSSPRRSWGELVADAHGYALAVAGTVAVGQTLSPHALRPREAFALGLDALVDSSIETRPLQEELLAALTRFARNEWGDLSAAEVHEKLLSVPVERVDGIMRNVQGTMLELRIGEAFADGSFDLPDELGDGGDTVPVSGVIADRNAEGLDGWLFDV